MPSLLHHLHMCQKTRWGYRCHGQPGECSAANPEVIEANMRQQEVDAFADWLTENGERSYLEYAHKRGIELDTARRVKPTT